jgi:hypothetical protein
MARDDHATMRAMVAGASPDVSSYRVTLFFGPEPVEGKPSIQYCVFNVKKRSWKGGIQVAVEVSRDQLDEIAKTLLYSEYVAKELSGLPTDDRLSYSKRANEYYAQAVCWCKLDLMLQSGITQENQCLAADILTAELRDAVTKRAGYITSYVLDELDLPPRDAAPSAR